MLRTFMLLLQSVGRINKMPAGQVCIITISYHFLPMRAPAISQRRWWCLSTIDRLYIYILAIKWIVATHVHNLRVMSIMTLDHNGEIFMWPKNLVQAAELKQKSTKQWPNSIIGKEGTVYSHMTRSNLKAIIYIYQLNLGTLLFTDFVYTL